MTQASLWQEQPQSPDIAELCNALYERELHLLALQETNNVAALQNRLKSLPYYINRTALSMTQTVTPLNLDVQNASWSYKQSAHLPINDQTMEQVNQWYTAISLPRGLIVPVLKGEHIILDCIDRVDEANNKFRTNVSGWFHLSLTEQETTSTARLLKPNKKVMIAACAGHCWQGNTKIRPIIPTLRELLLSCSINWKNFKTL